MSTPDERKNIKVSAATHRAVYALAATGETADDVLSRILGPGALLLELSELQRERWAIAARAGGMSVEEFVKARVEAALTFDADPTGLYVIHRQLEELFRRLPAPPAPRSQP